MSIEHEPFAELAAVYALGALDGPDVERFEAHRRAGCAECEQVLQEHAETLARLAGEIASRPPAHVRQAVLARLDAPARRDRAAERAPRRPASWVRAATGMALAAGIAGVAVGLWMDTRHRTELARLEREAATLRDEVAAERRLAALLADPSTQVVHLGGLAPSPSAAARVVWNGRQGGLLVASDLPAAPAGKAYELWAIAGGTPRPAGVFQVDAKGVGSLTLTPIAGVAKVDQFAVTLEPAAGVPLPTGAMFLASAPS